MTIVRLRQRGQLTLPKSLRQAASVTEGSPLMAETLGKTIVLSPAKRSALALLQEKIRETSQSKGITLKQLLKEIKAERKTFNARYYDRSATADTA